MHKFTLFFSGLVLCFSFNAFSNMDEEVFMDDSIMLEEGAANMGFLSGAVDKVKGAFDSIKDLGKKVFKKVSGFISKSISKIVGGEIDCKEIDDQLEEAADENLKDDEEEDLLKEGKKECPDSECEDAIDEVIKECY